jgi:putative RecB family exonuclease
VNVVGIELDLRGTLGAIELRGIIDRLDRCDDGRFVLTDYKTGRSPHPDRARGRLAGVLFYAHLCESVIGVRPSEVRLVYIGDEVVVVEEPTDQSMRGLLQRTGAVWAAIERACTTGDFRPSPSPLCKSCAFQSHCPAFATSRAA